MMDRYVIGIDIGTTSIKLIVLNEKRNVVYDVNAEHPLLTERAGWAEEDALIWWDNTLRLLRDTASFLDKSCHGAYEISAIGVSGMVPAIVLIGKDDNPLRRSIQQNDARCVEEIEELTIKLNQKDLFHRTGGFTNQQHVLPRLMWVKQHEPDVWQNIAHICGSYDWIVHHLTGEWSLEENWAVESGLYDIHAQQWITEYFHRFGLSLEWFPPVYHSQSIVGQVLPEVSTQTGIKAGTPVIAGSADHIASALSAGVVEDGDLLIKFGGAGDILFCTNQLVTHEKLFFDYHDIPGKYILNGCMASSGSLIRWFVDQFVQHTADRNIYHELDNQAETIGPGSDGLVILPYFLGEKTPIFDPKARGVLFGLSLHHTPAHIFRGILESVIFGFRHHLDVLAEKGLYPRRIYATNGGAKSRLWLQIAADILDSRIISYKGHPGSSLGAAFLAGKAVHLFTDWREVLDCLPSRVEYEPDPQAVGRYNVSYGVYRRLYESLKDDFHLMSDHLSGASMVMNS